MKKNNEIVEFIQAHIEVEKENYNDAKKYGINCAAACMADGALEAYSNLLDFINNDEK